jgi:hypothetical protein
LAIAGSLAGITKIPRAECATSIVTFETLPL